MADQTTIDRAPPRPPDADDPSGGGSGRGWVLLCSVGDRYEAEMIRGVLETEGLGPVVIEAVQVPGSWLLPSGHERLPQRVFVMRAVAEAARLALLEAGCALNEEPDAASSGDAERRWRSATRIVRWAVIVAVTGVFVSYVIHLVQGPNVPGG